MSGKVIETYQVRVYMNARELGLTQADSASIAEFSERSGQRIEAGDYQPNRGRVRDWRTCVDPLAEVWESELEPKLQHEPKLKPMTLFEYLQDQYPGKYGQVSRTLQRRVQAWKALHGPAPEVMFELRHEPGLMGFSDFTELKGITITINSKPFEHLLSHYRLAYSGWQYAQIIQGGESFIALSEGLQNALFACGGVPKQHRTDSLSAAYRNLGGAKQKPLTRLYDDLCHHYRLQPTRNTTSIAHENGSIESPHGHLKNRIEQALYLRGNFDFTSVTEYGAFIDEAVARLNAQHQQKIEAAKAQLQPLPKHRVADYEVLTVKVSCRSTIDVRCVLYSVPARLIGRQLELHLYHDRIVGYVQHQKAVELPRLRVIDKGKRRTRCINYRHVVEGLRRKPRAFLYCTWQQDLLPNDQWQDGWQQLKAQFELDSAAVLLVEALYIAATQDKEQSVVQDLQTHLETKTLTLVALRQHFGLLNATGVPQCPIAQHDLSSYDQLLSPTPSTESLPKPEFTPQATATLPHADPLGKPRTSSHARELVLRSVLAGSLRIGGTTALEYPSAKGFERSPTTKR